MNHNLQGSARALRRRYLGSLPPTGPKLEAFCRHYGTFLMPCRPKMAKPKGKVERNIRYIKSNGLQGHSFTSLAQESRHLAEWDRMVADVRIHGTTRKQVAALFSEEKEALLPLPAELFPCFQEAKRIVHRDQLRRLRQSLLSRSAGAYQPNGLGAVGQPLCADFQSAVAARKLSKFKVLGSPPK